MPAGRPYGELHMTDSRHERSFTLEPYAIIWRDGWASGDELARTAARSSAAGEEMADEDRWVCSYVLDEGDGRLGTVCVYEAASPEAIRTHALRATLPIDEVVPIADTVVVRPDPVPVAN